MVSMFFINIINLILAAIGKILNGVFTLLPKSPFTYLSASTYADFISKINYIIPVYEVITILEAWLIAIGLFYVYSVYARWLKAIE